MANGKFEAELHVHPIGLEQYGLEAIVDAAKMNNIDGVALVEYNNYIFPRIRELSQGLGREYSISSNEEVVKVSNCVNPVYILNAIELMTAEEIHVIKIGKSKCREGDSIYKIIESDDFTLIDHPLVDAKSTRKLIKPESLEVLKDVCEKYPGKIALEWNAYCLRNIWRILAEDVNKKTEEFAKKYNIPIVADTDLHGFNKDLMADIGKSRIKINSEDMDLSLDCIVPSIKKSILSSKHENVKSYVSLKHFIEAYGYPIIMHKLHNELYPHVRGKVKRL